MTPAKRSSESKRRGTLNKEQVIRAAIELADESGVASLTMRKLAEKLGVEAMSLYYHVANKDEILDGMVDAVFEEIGPPPSDGHWKNALKERSVAARQAMLRHPWAVSLMESRPNPGHATLQHHEAVIKCMREGGFTVVMAAHAFSAIDSYIYGFVMQEEALPFDTPEELEEVAEAILEQMPADQFPYFIEMITEHNLKPGYSYSDEFAFGLDLILDGFEQLVEN